MTIGASQLALAVAVGLGATLVMGLCALFLSRAFSIPLPNMCFVGRWVRYMPEGVFTHGSIAKAPPKSAECMVRWQARLRSVTNHALFGLGLYVSALALSVLR